MGNFPAVFSYADIGRTKSGRIQSAASFCRKKLFCITGTARRAPTKWLYIVIMCRGGYYPPAISERNSFIVFHCLFNKFSQSVRGFFGECSHKCKGLIMCVLVTQSQKTAEENICFIEISENIPYRFRSLFSKYNAYGIILTDKPRSCKTAEGFADAGA